MKGNKGCYVQEQDEVPPERNRGVLANHLSELRRQELVSFAVEHADSKRTLSLCALLFFF